MDAGLDKCTKTSKERGKWTVLLEKKGPCEYVTQAMEKTDVTTYSYCPTSKGVHKEHTIY